MGITQSRTGCLRGSRLEAPGCASCLGGGGKRGACLADSRQPRPRGINRAQAKASWCPEGFVSRCLTPAPLAELFMSEMMKIPAMESVGKWPSPSLRSRRGDYRCHGRVSRPHPSSAQTPLLTPVGTGH